GDIVRGPMLRLVAFLTVVVVASAARANMPYTNPIPPIRPGETQEIDLEKECLGCTKPTPFPWALTGGTVLAAGAGIGGPVIGRDTHVAGQEAGFVLGAMTGVGLAWAVHRHDSPRLLNAALGGAFAYSGWAIAERLSLGPGHGAAYAGGAGGFE